MRMREHNRAQAADINRRWRPVAQSEFLEALKQTAIQQELLALIIDEEFGSRDSTGRAQEV